jgi:hypothetical protein
MSVAPRVDSLAASTRLGSRPLASSGSRSRFPHQVAEGMHGAIVKAVKARTAEAKGLPRIEPAVAP